MTPENFGLSVLASWLANKLGSESNDKETTTISASPPEPPANKAIKPRLFKKYDVLRDLDSMLGYINNPVAHIIVERSPSSFYNLVSLVIEDTTTGIWFVFGKGRMSFQGTGGGAQQTDLAVNTFKNKNIPIAPWSVRKSTLDELEGGHILWQEVKYQLIPLVSSEVNSDEWPWIQSQAKGVLYNEQNV